MTPAIDLLERLGVEHRVVSYDHDPSTDSYGIEAAEALGLDPALVFKTLLVSVDAGETVVVVVPVATRVDLKALAREAGAKRAELADPNAARRLTGYVVGGISPLGQKRKLRTFIDVSAVDLSEIHVSAGRRGVEIALAPQALAELTNASFAVLTNQAGKAEPQSGLQSSP